MADPSPDIVSVRTIVTNADYLSNWITTVVVAASFSALISMKDKLTGAAIFLSFLASSLLAIADLAQKFRDCVAKHAALIGWFDWPLRPT